MKIDEKEYIKQYFKDHGAHGFDHAERVCNLAIKIGKIEKADLDVLKVAALLHDIGRDIAPKGVCHAEFGAEASKKILDKISFPLEKRDNVVHCIGVHRYSKGLLPKTKEAKIIQDADRLEELGAIALSRGLSEDIKRGKKLYDPKIAPNISYKSGANRTSINFLIEKSLKLKPETFHTKTAQEISKGRYKFTEEFVRRVIAEWKNNQ